MLRKICPCLSFLSSEAQEVPRKGYHPEQMFEEEDFMQQITSEANKSKSNSIFNEEISVEDQINYELNLRDESSEANSEKTNKNESIAQKEAMAEEFGESTNFDTLNEQKSDKEENEEKSYDFINLGELQINIPEYGPNFQLLKEKSHNAAVLLDITKDCSEVSIKTGKNSQESKLKVNKSKLRAWKSIEPGCYIIEYEIPCSYSFYSEMINRKIQPKDNHKLFRESRLIESSQQNLSTRYICLNKIGMLEPRDFTYIKYTNMSTTNPSGHWELCISKDIDKESVNPGSNIKAGKIFSVSYIIEDKIDSGIRVRVRSYVNLDIGATIDKIWERNLSETRTYVEELWEEAQTEYSEEQELI